MDILFDSDIPTPLFSSLNRCRLYHKILTLSDLLTGQGNKVRSYYWTANTIPHDNRTDWPHQGPPSKSDWQIWCRYLRTLFDLRANDGTITQQMQQGEGRVTTTWLWYYYQDSIYESKGEEWWIYSQIGRRRSRTKRYSHTATTASKPLLALPYTVERDGTRILMTGTLTPEQATPTMIETTSFTAYLKKILSIYNI